jgi:hypothetical protein
MFEMLIDTKSKHDVNIIFLTFQRNLLLPFSGRMRLFSALKMATAGVLPNS